MSPFVFDLIVIILVLLSAGLGFLRGFCNEIFTIFGWIGAVLATILLTPVSREFLRTQIHNKILADLATASIIFIVTMVIFSVISHYATKSLQGSKLNAVDRTLGFAFGVLRGVLFIGLMFLLIAWIYAPDNRPDFVKGAKTRPILESAAHLVQFILPGDATIEIDTKDTEGNKPDKLKEVMQPSKTDSDLKEFQREETSDVKTDTPDLKDKPADKPPVTPEKAN
jgi:uncharacterized membrane protein required for colicin V production